MKTKEDWYKDGGTELSQDHGDLGITYYNGQSHPTISGALITYQYSDKGEIDISSHGIGVIMLFDETVQERYHTFILRQYADCKYGKGEATWTRLCELSQEQLDRLPDNCFAIKQAWLCGLHPDGGEIVQRNLAYLQQYRDQRADKMRKEQELQEKIEYLKSLFTCRTIKSGKVQSDDGTDFWALIELTENSSGKKLLFNCRNILDFGYVVNPGYAINPGMEPGGCVNIKDGVRYWMDFRNGEGWLKVRDLTDLENLALDYLYAIPPVMTETRL